jgi:hypothetical protein
MNIYEYRYLYHTSDKTSTILFVDSESLGEKHALIGSDGNRIEKAHYDVVGQQLLVRILLHCENDK